MKRRNRWRSDAGDAKRGVSRRNFLNKALMGAGATAAVLGAGKAAAAAPATERPIRIPEEFDIAAKTPLPKIDFPMTGADVFARVCKAEGLAALFTCPGNYEVIHAIAHQGIPTVTGRHEGSMAHAADAFIRVTGEIAATSGTEGPGFTDMIAAIATANSARTPLLVLASNMAMHQEDTNAGIQLMYQQPVTEGMKKWGKRLVNPARIHEYAGYAFRQLRSGVPQPVHLDFPAEIHRAKIANSADLTCFYDKSHYRTDAKAHPSPKAIAAAVALLQKAERPIIVSSNGVFYDRAWDALKALAEKAQIPVVESGAMKGQISDESPLSANAAPDILPHADVVLLVGQHLMPTVGEFAFGPDTKYIRIDQVAEDIGRNIPIDVGIVSSERAGLEALLEAMPKGNRPAWLAEVAAARKQFEDENLAHYKLGASYTDAVHPAVIAKELADFMYRGSIPKEQTAFVSGGFGIARYVRRWARGYRPGQIMNGAYQFGTIGPDVAYGVGVAQAVQLGSGPQAPYKGAPVVVVTGDAGFGYTAMEIETMAKYRQPVIIIIYNNNVWGTWTGNSRDKTIAFMHTFQENLRYDKVSEALGGAGEYVTTPAELKPALERAYKTAVSEKRPTVINCQGKKEFWLTDKFPPGSLGKVEPGCMSYYH